MSVPTRKISDIATPAGALTATDRLEVSQGIGTTPVTRYLTPGQITDYVETDISTLPNGLITNAMVNASAGIVDTKLATISTAGKVANSATTATSTNTVNAIVARDANGDTAVRDVSARRLVLRGDTSGTATITVPAVAGTPTFTLPSSAGSSGQFLQTNGSGVLSWAAAGGAPSARFNLNSAETLTGGAWTTLSVAEILDPAGIATVSSGAITFTAGTYLLAFTVPVYVLLNATGSVSVVARCTDKGDAVAPAAAFSAQAGYTSVYEQCLTGVTLFQPSGPVRLEVLVQDLDGGKLTLAQAKQGSGLVAVKVA